VNLRTVFGCIEEPTVNIGQRGMDGVKFFAGMPALRIARPKDFSI
jgi:hypothetical protein